MPPSTSSEGAAGRGIDNEQERERERDRGKTQTTMANFATLESLKKGDEEEKKGNAYYAGGARGAGRGGRFVSKNGTIGEGIYPWKHRCTTGYENITQQGWCTSSVEAELLP